MKLISFKRLYMYIQFKYRLLILLIALVRSSEEVKSSIKTFRTLHFVLWSEILCSRSMQAAGGNNTVRIMLMPISFRQTLSSCRRYGPGAIADYSLHQVSANASSWCIPKLNHQLFIYLHAHFKTTIQSE